MKILFIPHVPNRKIINRVYEFAKTSNSYFLSWHIENGSLQEKLYSQYLSLFQKIVLKDNIVTMPLLFKPEGLAVKINTKILNYTLQKFNIGVVVNANALLFDIEKIAVPVIYDLVDDHLSINTDIGLTKSRIEKIRRDIQHAQAVVCVSDILKKKVKAINSNALTVENGLYLEKFEKSYSLKKELGLDGKKVFGYIGGVDEWTGIDRACASYVEIKDSTNAMIVVGGSSSDFFTALKEKYENDIIFTGIISPDKVGNYFKTINLGLIPFKLNDFTNNAYPIKALEYGLAGAMVLSTPLRVLESKHLPFIEFYDIKEFSKAMKNHIKKDFDFDFSNLSWERQTDELINFIQIFSNKNSFAKKHGLKKVLIYHSWGLGDTVMATPMLKALYKSGYEVNIILTSQINKKILENSGFIENIYILSNYKQMLSFAFMNYRKFDFLIGTLGINPNKIKLLSYLFGTKRYFAKYNDDNVHRIIDNVAIVKELLNKDIVIEKPYINMIDSKVIKSKYIKKDKKNIGFSIGSGYKQTYKRWNINNYIELFKYYENENILVFIGPDEKDLKEQLVDIKNIRLVNEPIENIISIIASLDLLVGTDNGLMHIAYGLEKETITLYGMTNEQEIGGYNPSIHHNLCLDIECRPCINSKTKIFKCDRDIECLKNITFDIVSKKMNKILYEN